MPVQQAVMAVLSYVSVWQNCSLSPALCHAGSAGVFYLLTLPLAVFAQRSAHQAELAKPGLYRANQLTILLHNVGTLTLAAGLLIPGLLA